MKFSSFSKHMMHIIIAKLEVHKIGQCCLTLVTPTPISTHYIRFVPCMVSARVSNDITLWILPLVTIESLIDKTQAIATNRG